jgi:adenosylhomocysteinase
VGSGAAEAEDLASFPRVDAAARSSIADPSLAPEGEARIRWVARHSPVLNRLARERLADGALRGRRVAVVVHLEAKTA